MKIAMRGDELESYAKSSNERKIEKTQLSGQRALPETANETKW